MLLIWLKFSQTPLFFQNPVKSIVLWQTVIALSRRREGNLSNFQILSLPKVSALCNSPSRWGAWKGIQRWHHYYWCYPHYFCCNPNYYWHYPQYYWFVIDKTHYNSPSSWVAWKGTQCWHQHRLLRYHQRPQLWWGHGRGSVFLDGEICTKVGLCSYCETSEYE
jgi:hypothetical protein